MISAQANYSTQVIHSKYYPHIDGIRTLAVIPVVLCHLLSALCPGGFAGVDVFFVISGYLITGGIIRDLNQGAFSIESFYHRRIKRILPAYSFLLFCVLIFTSVATTQENAKTVGYTSFFSTFFSSNIYFNNHSDYFSPNAKENPLLNLWSLSVEEQFYIVIPIFLILAWKLRKERFIGLLLFIFALSSFLGSVYGIAKDAQSFVFYMLPTRAWELLAGSMIALMKQRINTKTAPLFALTGLACVFFPYVFYTSHSPFPGLAALPSVLGTCLLIRYGSTGIVGHLLRSSPFVGIGKISYSLYLWHWPIIVFWTYITYDNNKPLDYIGILALSFAMAYFSWKWIEMPVRCNQKWLPRQSFCFAAVVLMFLAVYSFLIYGTKRLTQYFGHTITRSNYYEMHSTNKLCLQRPNHELTYALLKKRDPNALRILGKKDGTPTFVIWGNSHAGNLFPAMDRIARECGKTGYIINFRSTPVMGVYTTLGDGIRVESPEKPEIEMKWLLENPSIKEVFLIARWSTVYPTNPFPAGQRSPISISREENFRLFRKGLMETCSRLGNGGKKVILFTGVPRPDFFVHEVLEKQKIIPKKTDYHFEIPSDVYDSTNEDILTVLGEISRAGLAEVIPVHKAFLRGHHYVTVEGRRVYYSDDHHLSVEGSEVAGDFLAPLLWKNER